MSGAAESPYDGEAVVGIYTRNVRGLGPNHYAQGWVSRASQERRFAVLADVGDFRDASVLDVGCGVADLYAYLHRRNIGPSRYAGMDFTPAMLQAARKRFPSVPFYQADILDLGEPPETADYVVASGLFSHMNEALLRQAVPTLFGLCRRGLAFNILSAWAPGEKADLFHADPAETLRWCRTLTAWTALRHDYQPHDFTIYLYREPYRPATEKP